MVASWQLLLVIGLYIIGIFFIAYWGDKRAHKGRPVHNTPIIYSLSLAVYCTSWTFYGAVGQASENGWLFLTIYVGPMLLFMFFWGFMGRIIRITKEKRLTSIADFISTRYGQVPSLGVLVTFIAVIGVIPYIALQLKAIAAGYELVSTPITSNLMASLDLVPTPPETIFSDTAFHVSWLLALFVIVFGTRDMDASEQHPGLMMAISAEALIKLFAFLAVGIWTLYTVFDGPTQMLQSAARIDHHPLFESNTIWLSFLLQSLLAGFAMLALPRQFHVGVIENDNVNHLATARWVFPAYLLLMLIFVVPIAFAGHIHLSDLNFQPDTYVLSLPALFDQPGLAVLVFLGGTSAAIGMIMIASLAVSIMISNEWVLPLVFRSLRRKHQAQSSEQLKNIVITVRRLIIVVLMSLSYLFYTIVGELESLAAIGLLSFAAAAQFAPSLIGGMVWQKGNHTGAMTGMIAGISIWFFTLLWPVISRTGEMYISSSTTGLANFLSLDYFSFGVIASLTINTLLYIGASLLTPMSVRERLLANEFVNAKLNPRLKAHSGMECKVDDIQVLLERVLGSERATEFLKSFEYEYGKQAASELATPQLLHQTKQLLASAVGNSSAQILFSTMLGGKAPQINDMTSIMTETEQALSTNRGQLHTALENLSQGVSIVDNNLNLIAWNKRYLEIFNYPVGLIRVGRPIVDIIRFNAQRGFCGEGEITQQITRRMNNLRARTPHYTERELPNGKVIAMQGRPMPNGGFVTSFTDITAHRNAERALQEANVTLERKVEESSQELETLTQRLIEANDNKSHFLAATGHDLMQPLNAAKLFASTLAQSDLNDHQLEMLDHLEGSLQSAEDVLSILVEISKLDAGAIEPKAHSISLHKIFKPLKEEFGAIAREKDIELRYHTSDFWVNSDPQWLRRIIQNFISNAVRYTDTGGVLFGCRRSGDNIHIQVWDTGTGIPEEKIKEIFKEFQRLTQKDSKGLGLGLAIADRMAKKLGHKIHVFSKEGKGTCFELTVPMAEPQQPEIEKTPNISNVMNTQLDELTVFCIDNDEAILTGMKALLGSWGCQIIAVSNEDEAAAIQSRPDIMLADFQLDSDVTGLEVMTSIRERFRTGANDAIPGVLITADPRESTAEQAKELDFYFLKKPLKPAALRALIQRIMNN